MHIHDTQKSCHAHERVVHTHMNASDTHTCKNRVTLMDGSFICDTWMRLTHTHARSMSRHSHTTYSMCVNRSLTHTYECFCHTHIWMLLSHTHVNSSDTHTSKSHVTNIWMCLTLTHARIMSRHSHTTHSYAFERIVDTRTWMHLTITHMNASDTHTCKNHVMTTFTHDVFICLWTDRWHMHMNASDAYTYECVWHTHMQELCHNNHARRVHVSKRVVDTHIWMHLTHTHMNASDTHTYDCVWHTHMNASDTHMNASDTPHQKLLGSGFSTPMSPSSLVCTFSFELNGNAN